MDISKHTAHHFKGTRAFFAAFSLVEVTLAIGIVGSAVVVVVGLFSPGMSTFRQAMNTSVGGQIAQQLISEAQQTDFDVLTTAAVAPGTNGTFNKPDRYFDEQGVEIVPVTPGAPAADEKSKIIYWVRTRVTPATALPKKVTPVPDNANLATVIVQIANNPSNQPLAQETGAQDESKYPLRNLWSGAFQSDTTKKVVPNIFYSTLVSRNK